MAKLTATKEQASKQKSEDGAQISELKGEVTRLTAIAEEKVKLEKTLSALRRS